MNGKMFDAMGRASVLGLHLVSGILVGGGLGLLVDRWLDCNPWGVLVGLVFGIAAGFRNLWQDARLLIRHASDDRQSGGHNT